VLDAPRRVVAQQRALLHVLPTLQAREAQQLLHLQLVRWAQAQARRGGGHRLAQVCT
jgi:hypothetical protein